MADSPAPSQPPKKVTKSYPKTAPVFTSKNIITTARSLKPVQNKKYNKEGVLDRSMNQRLKNLGIELKNNTLPIRELKNNLAQILSGGTTDQITKFTSTSKSIFASILTTVFPFTGIFLAIYNNKIPGTDPKNLRIASIVSMIVAIIFFLITVGIYMGNYKGAAEKDVTCTCPDDVTDCDTTYYSNRSYDKGDAWKQIMSNSVVYGLIIFVVVVSVYSIRIIYNNGKLGNSIPEWIVGLVINILMVFRETNKYIIPVLLSVIAIVLLMIVAGFVTDTIHSEPRNADYRCTDNRATLKIVDDDKPKGFDAFMRALRRAINSPGAYSMYFIWTSIVIGLIYKFYGFARPTSSNNVPTAVLTSNIEKANSTPQGSV